LFVSKVVVSLLAWEEIVGVFNRDNYTDIVSFQ
jgi:hypothetical protein